MDRLVRVFPVRSEYRASPLNQGHQFFWVATISVTDRHAKAT
ncbi:hypothetical protein GZL_01032 [Streptomyces sp. 769]|nr:hypothetical protein GZL_01032 [Streptomyces sp. 769]